ncbi:nucleotidyltransferase family protein [Candidatus Margulisiibacteriota bacterium]
MSNDWIKSKGLKAVVICGGRGTRLDPLTGDMAKSMVQVLGKPILDYVIDYWRQFTDEFVFVLGYKAQDIIEHVKGLAIKAEFIVEKEAQGIAGAVALAKNSVTDKFIVLLGDCVVRGNFIWPPKMEMGCGVWETDSQDDIKRSYAVELKDQLIEKLVEKPKEIKNNLCGMGFYFFDQRIFEFIAKSKPTPLKNQVELTNVMQEMVEAGIELSPVRFKGEYLNITFPEDLKKAEKIVG